MVSLNADNVVDTFSMFDHLPLTRLEILIGEFIMLYNVPLWYSSTEANIMQLSLPQPI